MAKYQVTSPDGQKFEIEAPDGASQADVMAYAKQQWKAKPAEPVAPTNLDVATSHGASALGGLLDPIDALAQLAPRGGGLVAHGVGSALGAARSLAPDGMINDALKGLSASANKAGDWFDKEAAGVDKIVKGRNTAINDYRQKAGREGFDATRLLGNIVNPVNALPAAGLAGKAATAGRTGLQLAAGGAKVGLLSSALQPVLDTDNFALEKASQAGMGLVLGGVLAPVTAKLGGAIASRVKQVSNMLNRPPVDKVIADALADAGMKADDFSAAQMAGLRKSVQSSLKTGKILDPAALARKMDFEDLGMAGTSGQVMRDPMQFARERNLRGAEGIGEPLMARMTEQDRQLTSLMGKFSDGAQEPVIAGEGLLNRLSSVDKKMQGRVSDLYKAAREITPDTVPTTGLAQDLANIASDFEGSVPKGLINRLSTYGFLGGKQTKVFDMLEAEKLLQATNQYGNVTDKASQTALAKIRTAIKSSITDVDAGGGPFATARLAARERFNLQDAVPALEAAASGNAVPDSFVNKYVFQAPVAQVKKMAALLDDESFKEAKAQIGEKLRTAAFSGNETGDKIFSPDRFNRELKKLGASRLSSFFDAEEIRQLKRIGRVAAYIHTQPANAAVNSSNTTGALYNMARSTGSGLFNQPVLNMIPSVAKKYADQQAVSYALTQGVDPLIPLLSRTGQARLGLLSGAAPALGGLLAGSPN